MSSPVRQNEHGLWEVFFNGEMIARVKTNREAWREHDRKVRDHLNKEQAKSEYFWNERVHRDSD